MSLTPGPARWQSPLVLLAGLAVVLLALILVVVLVFGSAPKPTPGSPTPGGSPTTTSLPSAFGSPANSGLGGPTPSASAVPGTPTTSQLPFTTPARGSTDPPALLELHIPETIRAACVATTGIEPIVAVATCQSSDGLQLTYWQYADSDSMNAAYSGFVSDAQIDRDSGTCLVDTNGTVTAKTDSWPSENAYAATGAPAGRYLCLMHNDSASVYWTDDRLDILSQVTGPAASADRLVGLWLNEAGPVL